MNNTVTIFRCTVDFDHYRWYADKIGETFELAEEQKKDSQFVTVICEDGIQRLVLRADTEEDAE